MSMHARQSFALRTFALRTFALAMLMLVCVPLRAATSDFTLAPLPYPYDALEPAIDARTMQIHHGKHHQAYVDNLNRAIATDATLRGQPLEALMSRMSTSDVRMVVSACDSLIDCSTVRVAWPTLKPRSQRM